jgi:lipooligosaccharide transport system ATP-binding protein
VLTTHYMDEAQRLCDRVAILDNGRILDMGSPAELIARHVEPLVMEVHGRGAQAWFAAKGRALVRRSESVGETIFCYTDDARALSDTLANAPDLSWLHRPGNLEDVFLRLTGRELRDQ